MKNSNSRRAPASSRGPSFQRVEAGVVNDAVSFVRQHPVPVMGAVAAGVGAYLLIHKITPTSVGGSRKPAPKR